MRGCGGCTSVSGQRTRTSCRRLKQVRDPLPLLCRGASSLSHHCHVARMSSDLHSRALHDPTLTPLLIILPLDQLDNPRSCLRMRMSVVLVIVRRANTLGLLLALIPLLGAHLLGRWDVPAPRGDERVDLGADNGVSSAPSGSWLANDSDSRILRRQRGWGRSRFQVWRRRW